MVTDYDYNPQKKPAPPAFNKVVEEDILKQAKQLVSNHHSQRYFGYDDKSQGRAHFLVLNF